ncbi:MAG TPA: guanylate kinase, partial [Kofleriaceae bacterium]|nr:guanylate kinase [Kofleriaceae bacterium]
MPKTTDRGVLVIVSSPSGAGKTTLTRRLLEEFKGQLEFSVSYTTRPMRPGEVDGRDYHFVSTDKFEEMVERGEFAEHAYVHGNRYGTAEAPIESALAAGHDIIFDVDFQGGASLSSRWPKDSLKI